MRHASRAVFLTALILSVQAQAQTTRSVQQEYDDTIKAAQTVTALGPDLFGEAVDLKDGTTSFSAVDVSLPTNSGLSVAVGRSYGVNARDIDQYVNAAADGELFGNWKLEAPYISGTYDERTGWVSRMPNPQQRCSPSAFEYAGPPGVPSLYTGWNLSYYPDQYWHGDNIRIPGKGGGPLLYLPSDRSRPSDGRSYYWTTKDNWRISCTPSLKNGSGEGYVAVLPDGTRYTFDWISSRKVASLKDKVCYRRYFDEYNATRYSRHEWRAGLIVVSGGPIPTVVPYLYLHENEDPGGMPNGSSTLRTVCSENIVVNRREYFLHATRVEDRFGNWVAYDYDPANPRRLRSITSNDGVSISLAYGSHGKIASVNANGRIWQYQYASADGAVLSAVVQPDGSRWSFQYGDLYGLLHYDNQKVRWPDCEPFIAQAATAALTIGHPSGAQGTFTFRSMLHGIDRTPGGCSQPDPDRPLDVEVSPTPMVYKAASLVSKQIAGPGLATRTWDYAYQPSWSWNPSGYVDDPNTANIGVGTTTTEVTAPDGTITRSIFGNDYYRNAGQLQRVEIVSAGVTVQSASYEYVTDAAGHAFPDRIGLDPNARNNRLATERLRPLRQRTLTQDGDTYHWIVDTCGSATTYCFDAFARPTTIRRQNSMGAYKREVTEYHDNTGLWVLGQVSRVYVPETSISGMFSNESIVVSQTDYDATARPWKTYAFGKLQQIYSYWPDGNVNTITDGGGNTTWLGQYRRGIPGLIGHPETPEVPAGATESAEIDDNGWIRSVTNEVGAKTCFDYDAMGRMSNVIYPSEAEGQNGVCDLSSWANRYSEFRQLAETEWMPTGVPLSRWRHYVEQGNYVKITYMDALWRPVLVHEYDASNVGPTLRSTRTEYGVDGRVSFQSYPTSDLIPGSVGIRTFYDPFGRTRRVEQDSEQSVLVTTNEYLNGLRVRVTNPRGYQSISQFMAWDEPNYDLPISSVQPEGKVQMIERHPRFGWPQRLTQRSADDSVQQSRSYVYDGNAQLCKTIEPETGVTVSGTDAAGNPAWSVAGLDLESYGSLNDCQYVAASGTGLAVTRQYDKRNQLRTLTFPGGRGNQIWTYTPDGLPASVTAYNDPGNTTPTLNVYTYNKRRLLTGESTSQPGWYTWSLGYGYDRIGNLANHAYPTGRTLYYDPNALGLATGARDQFGQVYASGASYYPNSAIKQFTYGNGIVHSMQQNARQLPARVTDSGGALDFAYSYDQSGNIASIWDHARDNGNGYYGRWMNYDGLDRLTAAGSCSFGGDCWHRFTYDALDNLESWKLPGVKDYADYVYDTRNRLTSIRNSAGATIVGLGYDAQGNLNNKNGQTYQFDYGNRLRSVDNKEAYRYDGLGRRVLNWRPAGVTGANTSLSLSMYSQSGQLIYIWDDQYPKHLEHIYLAGSVITIRETSHPNGETTLKYQHTDALGSPVAVTNAAGQVIERNDYEPWGTIIGQPNKNGIAFTGHMMDGATGLIYMQQRYYDPTIGRFLSVDPVSANSGTGANFNRYWYANNNPYRYIDPDGRESTGEIIDGYAMKAASEDRHLATYGWAFVAVSWKYFGAEGVSQVADKGSNASTGDKVSAVIEVVTVGKGKTIGEVGGALFGRAKAFLRIGCSFDDDTLVQTDRGLIRISDIKVGDKVLSRNEETGIESYQLVTATVSEWHDSTLTVSVSRDGADEAIITTDEHPFYVEGKGFVPAASLRLGDILELAEGRSSKVIGLKRNNAGQYAHNLTVANDHTYFVGRSNVLVHNSCYWAHFASQTKLLEHFGKHGAEFGAKSAEEYLQIGRDIMRNGHKVTYRYGDEIRTGYVAYMRNSSKGGRSIFGFVGTNAAGEITTIHAKGAKDLWKLLNGSAADKTIRVAE